jgi:hypothetical protein
MTKGILRDVSYEIDKFEMDHYNEDKEGLYEEIRGFIDSIDESINELRTRKHIDPEEIAEDLSISRMNTTCYLDNMESIGVQNGLVRSKHLQNLMLAAKIRDTRDTENWHDPKIDHVEVKIPWYKVDNLIEKLYLKYHKTRIHECFDMMQRYLIDDDSDYAGIYSFWKEIEDLWDEVWGEETLSNHYHTDDDYWEHDIDPKECKNLRDFFKKRITTQIKKKLEQDKEDQEKEEELKILRAKENKFRKYTSIEEFSNNQLGSVYWFADVKQKFATSKKLPFGILYVGESRNFNNRFAAYAHKDGDRYSALEQRLINKFPKTSKSEIKEFVRDREQCKLRVITNKKLSNSNYRLRCERRLITISQPLLNLK